MNVVNIERVSGQVCAHVTEIVFTDIARTRTRTTDTGARSGYREKDGCLEWDGIVSTSSILGTVSGANTCTYSPKTDTGSIETADILACDAIVFLRESITVAVICVGAGTRTTLFSFEAYVSVSAKSIVDLTDGDVVSACVDVDDMCLGVVDCGSVCEPVNKEENKNGECNSESGCDAPK